MKRILIADSSKASLVMTSEVFKDYYPGIQVLVARNSADAITLAKTSQDIDAFIVDFDLPDINGAQTALLLKKISKTPILITSFDNVDAIRTIETLLVKYNDCKSWLKKPINPEVVIAIAQRYCDGVIRAQKRVSCHLPALSKMEVVKPTKKIINEKLTKTKIEINKVSSVKAAKEKTTKKEEAKQEAIPLSFYGIIEDCSLSGVRLRPSKNINNGSQDWADFLENIEYINKGSVVSLKIPRSIDIEFGQVEDLTKVKLKKSTQENKKTAALKKVVSSKAVVKMIEDEKTQTLNGKVIWTSSESGEWCMGIEFEDQGLSKRLFEAVVALHSRQNKGAQNQSIMKASRSA